MYAYIRHVTFTVLAVRVARMLFVLFHFLEIQYPAGVIVQLVVVYVVCVWNLESRVHEAILTRGRCWLTKVSVFHQ